MSTRSPASGRPLLADEERNGAEHVRAPRVPAGEGRRELVERGMRERVRVGCDAPSAADGDHASVVGRLRSGERGDAQRQLEHEPAGVVGDPAEDVEPARGARDRDGCAGGEERARADLEAERLGVARIEARGPSGAQRRRRHGRSLPDRATARRGRLPPVTSIQRRPFGTTPGGEAVDLFVARRLGRRRGLDPDVRRSAAGASRPGPRRAPRERRPRIRHARRVCREHRALLRRDGRPVCEPHRGSAVRARRRRPRRRPQRRRQLPPRRRARIPHARVGGRRGRRRTAAARVLEPATARWDSRATSTSASSTASRATSSASTTKPRRPRRPS